MPAGKSQNPETVTLHGPKQKGLAREEDRGSEGAQRMERLEQPWDNLSAIAAAGEQGCGVGVICIEEEGEGGGEREGKREKEEDDKDKGQGGR